MAIIFRKKYMDSCSGPQMESCSEPQYGLLSWWETVDIKEDDGQLHFESVKCGIAVGHIPKGCSLD